MNDDSRNAVFSAMYGALVKRPPPPATRFVLSIVGSNGWHPAPRDLPALDNNGRPPMVICMCRGDVHPVIGWYDHEKKQWFELTQHNPIMGRVPIDVVAWRPMVTGPRKRKQA